MGTRLRAHFSPEEADAYRHGVSALASEPGVRHSFRDKFAEEAEAARELARRLSSVRSAEKEAGDSDALCSAFVATLLSAATSARDRWRRLSSPPRPDGDAFDLPRLKAVPVENLFAFGRLRRVGNRSTALCPFHAEKTGSFVIFHDDNHFHCFGCGAAGDAISFVRLRDGCSFPEACRALASCG